MSYPFIGIPGLTLTSEKLISFWETVLEAISNNKIRNYLFLHYSHGAKYKFHSQMIFLSFWMNKGVKSGWKSQMLWEVSAYTIGKHFAYLCFGTTMISLGWASHPSPLPVNGQNHLISETLFTLQHDVIFFPTVRVAGRKMS